jgi:hypothetical protein
MSPGGRVVRPLRAWAVLVVIAGVGGGVGAVAVAWLPAWAAAVVSAIGAGIAGSYTAWAQELIGRRGNPLTRSARARVGDINDPIPLGVHPSEARRQSTGMLDRLPDFVARDLMPEVCDRLEVGGFVLLIGESTAGKSRLAYEAMHAALPDHWFHRPFPGESLENLVAVVSSGRHVVWLDELDLYLGAGGLSVSTLGQFLVRRRRRHVVVLATMRVREYDRYSARNRDASDAATWRAGRAVLLLAENPIELSRGWSATELLQARTATRDQRVARAVARADRFGVAEVLAAGPELVADWKRAATIGDRPRGAALVSCA